MNNNINETEQHKSSLNINRQYKILTYSFLLLLMIATLLLVYRDYRHFLYHEKINIHQEIIQKQTYIDSLLLSTNTYVKQMQLFIENKLEEKDDIFADSSDLVYPDHKIIFSKRRKDNKISLFLNSKQKSINSLKEINMASELLEYLHNNYATTKHFIWSYYASKEGLILLYPSMPDEMLPELFPNMNLDEIIDVSIYQRPHWKMSTPNVNQKKSPFWTKAYPDDGGNGLIITHGTPIYSSNGFQGMFAVDITLNFLSKALGDIEHYDSKISIVNENNQILASEFILEKDRSYKNIHFINEILSDTEQEEFNKYKNNKESGIVETNDSFLFITHLNNAPFFITSTIQKDQFFNRFLQFYTTNILFLVIIILILLTILRFLKNKFILPLDIIAKHIYSDTSQAVEKDHLPIEWQGWMEQIMKYPAMRSVTENLPGAIIRIQAGESDVKLIYTNERIKKLLGIEKSLKNINITDIYDSFSDKKDITRFQKVVSKSYKGSSQIVFECQINIGDKKKWIVFIATENESFENLFLDGIIMDITSQKIAEENLLQLNETLEKRVAEEVSKRKQNEEKLNSQARLASMGEMIGAIAHQWRQPLNAVSLMIQDLEDAAQFGELTNEYAMETVQKVMPQVIYMSETIDDFRNYFRPNNESEEFDIIRVIHETIKLLSAQMISNKITVLMAVNGKDIFHNWEQFKEAEIVETMPYKSYPNELKQVLLNLLKNSSDAITEQREKTDSDQTGIIKISISETEKRTLITVEDNGGGIPQNCLDSIFDPYFTTKDKSTGTGVGLYMSKNIVEDHIKGELSFENTKDGASFTISLPKNQKLSA